MSKETRKHIIKRDKKCLRCGTVKYLTIDHIIPISKGGTWKFSNLQTLCAQCNQWKADKTIDFRNVALSKKVEPIKRKSKPGKTVVTPKTYADAHFSIKIVGKINIL